jgi:hypothetical protein
MVTFVVRRSKGLVHVIHMGTTYEPLISTGVTVLQLQSAYPMAESVHLTTILLTAAPGAHSAYPHHVCHPW